MSDWMPRLPAVRSPDEEWPAEYWLSLVGGVGVVALTVYGALGPFEYGPNFVLEYPLWLALWAASAAAWMCSEVVAGVRWLLHRQRVL